MRLNIFPLPSRILAIADTYDAMTQDRVYRTAVGKEMALEEIRQNTGSRFDPAVAAVFFQVIEEYSRIVFMSKSCPPSAKEGGGFRCTVFG